MKENWLNKNYRWFVPVLTGLVLIVYLISSSNLGKTSQDLAQAYAEQDLYQNAISLSNKNTRVLELIGEIQPIDKMTILNGEVRYFNDNQSVTSTIKVQGNKGKAKLDLSAQRNGDKWMFNELKIRPINSSEEKQSIHIVAPEQ